MVDLADDRFDVTFDSTLVSVADVLGAIRDLGYDPEVVDTPVVRTAVADRIDLDAATLPDDLRALFVEAAAKDKPVLVEFSGPG